MCYLLFSVNGAGKTTTISMLTGEFPPTSGRAFLGGFNVATEPREVQRLMGYCPQFDALNSLLTAKETLELYAKIRGVPDHKIGPMVFALFFSLSLSLFLCLCDKSLQLDRFSCLCLKGGLPDFSLGADGVPQQTGRHVFRR